MNLFAFELSKITQAVTEEMTFEYDKEQQVGVWQANPIAEACITGYTCRSVCYNSNYQTGQYCTHRTSYGCNLTDTVMDSGYADFTYEHDGPCPGGSCS